jgi:hypothetical protein
MRFEQLSKEEKLTLWKRYAILKDYTFTTEAIFNLCMEIFEESIDKHSLYMNGKMEGEKFLNECKCGTLFEVELGSEAEYCQECIDDILEDQKHLDAEKADQDEMLRQMNEGRF